MKLWKKILIGFGALILVLLASAVVWGMSSTSKAEPLVAPYLQSSDTVIVEDGKWLTFSPVEKDPEVGFIFYPGGNVDHYAYAPALYKIAEAGYLVVDVPMPMDLAVLAPEKAMKVIEAHPEITEWVIGGHSLGGAMAARFMHEHPREAKGLALWAAYPAESNDISCLNRPVISLYGTLDGVAQPFKIERSMPLLPEDTEYIPLEGGNHAQFGFYGLQNRDGTPTISREEQQAQIVEAMVTFLAGFE